MGAVQTAGVDVVDARAVVVRMVSVRDQLQAHWREVVRRKTPAEREEWLKTAEAHAALGVDRVRELLKALRRRQSIEQMNLCSGAWLDAHYNRGCEQYPPGGEADTAMVVSRELTSWGDERPGDTVLTCTPPSRRWTPPQAVSTEDMLDGKSEREAMFYRYPPSPSAVAIFVVTTYNRKVRKRFLGGTGRTGVRRERQAAERHAQQREPAKRRAAVGG